MEKETYIIIQPNKEATQLYKTIKQIDGKTITNYTIGKVKDLSMLDSDVQALLKY